MAKKKIDIDNAGERMVPEVHGGTLIYAEHLLRYLSAQAVVKNKVVLDIACGSGYGTHLIAKEARKVYGVDIDKPTIQYAEQHYAAPNIEFLVGDGVDVPLEDNLVDVIVTFETIEHIQDYPKFMEEMKRILKPDGLIIISTPNDLEFAEGNHFHYHEFRYKELVELLQQDFKYIDSFYQATWKAVVLSSHEAASKEGPVGIPLLNYAPPKTEQYLYFYLVCSNRKITEKIKPLAALAEHYSDREFIGMQMNNESNIEAYKEVVNNLKAENFKISERHAQIEARLKAIVNSRSYKLARKISKAKQGVINRGRKQS